jgi:MOSC domain-containing protein YiiM
LWSIAGEREERMRLLSVNTGLPREVASHGRTVVTSIWKRPVTARVHVGRLNIAGDQQADLAVHGGPEKAVYAYPSEHYEYWTRELPGTDLPWGAFGENFTTEGLLEQALAIGDRLRVGSAEFLVTQPRMPCYKLGIRFSRDDMVKRFLQSGRSGFYLAVLREGEVGAGDPIEVARQGAHGVTVADIVALYRGDADDQALLRRALEVQSLPEAWRTHFRKRLWDPDA